MGDLLYYETASGRVARRDFKSTAELRAALREADSPDDEAKNQAALDRRLEHVGKFGNAQVRGVNWIARRANQCFALLDSVAEAAAGVEEGAIARERDKLTRERQMLEATLQTQTELSTRYRAQVAAARLAAEEAERRKAAERKEAIAAVRSRRKRKGA